MQDTIYLSHVSIYFCPGMWCSWVVIRIKLPQCRTPVQRSGVSEKPGQRIMLVNLPLAYDRTRVIIFRPEVSI